MNRDKMEMWLADLATTTDPQATGALTTPEGDCCLGRACKVALSDGLNVAVSPAPDYNGYVYYNGASATPPEEVTRWLGLEDDEADNLYADCMNMNDEQNLTFAEIAEAIRKEYLEIAEAIRKDADVGWLDGRLP